MRLDASVKSSAVTVAVIGNIVSDVSRMSHKAFIYVTRQDKSMPCCDLCSRFKIKAKYALIFKSKQYANQFSLQRNLR